VVGLSNLTCRRINASNISKAGDYLHRFSKEMEVLYGHSNCTFNVHLLTHLSDFASEYGPLQNISMFPFEDFNSCVMNFVKGTQYVSSQVAKRYLQKIVTDNCTPDETIPDYPELYNSCSISVTFEDEVMLSFKYSKQDLDCAEFYQRVKFKNKIFQSSSYTRVTKRNSSVVFFSNEKKVLEIDYFISFGKSKDVIGVGLLHELRNSNSVMLSELAYVYESKNSYRYFVNLLNIRSVALVVNHESNRFFMEFLNDVENFKD